MCASKLPFLTNIGDFCPCYGRKTIPHEESVITRGNLLSCCQPSQFHDLLEFLNIFLIIATLYSEDSLTMKGTKELPHLLFLDWLPFLQMDYSCLLRL